MRWLGRNSDSILPGGPVDGHPDFLDNRMRRPPSKPPDLWHELDVRAEFGLRVKLDRHRMSVYPTVLRDIRDVC